MRTRIIAFYLAATVTCVVLGMAVAEAGDYDGYIPPELPATTTTAPTTTVPTTTTTTTPVSWHNDEVHCDGAPCGDRADSPTEMIVCPATGEGHTFGAGWKQMGGKCPHEDAEEEVGFVCPPDDWRRDDVRIDYAAEAEGCGPLVGVWL